MILTIKPECIGLTVTRNNPVYGNITFDYYKVLPEHYINYYNVGFNLFNVTKTK